MHDDMINRCFVSCCFNVVDFSFAEILCWPIRSLERTYKRLYIKYFSICFSIFQNSNYYS